MSERNPANGNKKILFFRIPAMLAELRNTLCFLDPFYFPIKETYLSGPSHARNDTLLSFVMPTHRRLRGTIVDEDILIFLTT